MKLIDEKGKIFGKINIIDLFVLLVLLIIIGAAGYKLSGNKVQEVFGNSVQLSDITFTSASSVSNSS